MLPTLNDGDKVLVIRHWPTKWLRKGDIVVSYGPTSNGFSDNEIITSHRDSIIVIKRIIGLAGDIVSVSSEITSLTYYFTAQKNSSFLWEVPAKHYFLQGDAIGDDSRIWGPLPLSTFIGIAIAKLS